MKKPVLPTKPTKPIKPSRLSSTERVRIDLAFFKKEYDENNEEEFDAIDKSKIFTLQDLLDNIPEGISYKDITFDSLDWCEWDTLPVAEYTYHFSKEEIEEDFKDSMKEYEKELVEFKKESKDYKNKLIEYQKHLLLKEKEALEKKLSKLKKIK